MSMATTAQPKEPTPRSCHRCSQRKIRCNKIQPCAHCAKSKAECTFPGPGRAPRSKKRPLKAELVARLKGLEQEIKESTHREGQASQYSPYDLPTADLSQIVANQHGKLFVNGTSSSQYTTHEALVGLEDQVGLNQCVALPEIEPNNFENHLNEADGSQFLFGYSSIATSLESFHPIRNHCRTLWRAYEENVAPVVMVFHTPTLLEIVCQAARERKCPDRPTEAVVFAVYFAAVTSMDPAQCEAELGQPQSWLLHHFRFAAQQALARAGFLKNRNQMVLQAAVLFLTCLRRPKDAPFVWALTAAIHRLAQGMGLHRDGTRLGSLTPFEIEMRRRLWWSVYLLEVQASEFQAIGINIREDSYDTEPPSNINDNDFSPDTENLPEAGPGYTDITFCLVRIEMNVHRQRSSLNAPTRNGERNLLGERLTQLKQIHTRLQDRYLKFCSTSVPIQWVTATVIRLALSRYWLLAHLGCPAKAENGTDSTSPFNKAPDNPKKNQLFATAIEVVEFSYLLETDPRTKKWSWFFKGYPQWQAVIFVLSELCSRPRTPEADQAWVLMDNAVSRWKQRDSEKGSVALQTVFRLMERAAAVHGKTWQESESGNHNGETAEGGLSEGDAFF
ncbi:Zn(II)2Cys6 transcription factor [Aspergillus stella-maris]|uniref:Zn(II)2Cys6 transcription factor n=1 Tax=Aspergillus stella-maris TaxID=1810926 RepID=UPI003CCD6F55